MAWERAATVLALPLLAASLPLGATRAQAEEVGGGALELRIVTYNTHGLPGWIARDRPGWRFPRIGRLFSAYEVALAQEDFAHHRELRTAVSHGAIVRGNEDSGLTTLAGFPPDRIVEVERVPYGTCSGWIGGANDCLADKGFLRVRLALPNGALLDLVNTHLDAGDGEDDQAARAAQLDVLRSRLCGERRAALVLGGDLNLDWNVPHERALLDGLVRDLALVDSGARPASPWDRIDYLFLRETDEVALEVVGAGMAKEFVAEGKPLSDHPALFVHLRVRSRSADADPNP